VIEMKVSENEIRNLIVEICGIEKDAISNDSTFKEDMKMDSLNIADLIASLEEDYGILVNQQDALEIQTFGQLINYIKSLG
jgi:acyl carrier protein